MANTLEYPCDPLGIAARLTESNHNSLKERIYCVLDGAVTTFAIVSGDVQACLSPTVVIILGFADLVGEGFSVAVCARLGTRAQISEPINSGRLGRGKFGNVRKVSGKKSAGSWHSKGSTASRLRRRLLKSPIAKLDRDDVAARIVNRC
ncbi:MAG: VIT1/CCC1 transporter family protein [Planctomycetota bacterium]|nr:VIT1/CCC1 transporter family protein [Planctomycetota bacterium]